MHFCRLFYWGHVYLGPSGGFFQPVRWQLAFNWGRSLVDLAHTGPLIPALDDHYVCHRRAGRVVGLDWLWIGLMLFADIASYGGGAGRKQIPGYQGY
ncbi:MAG: hypothetical protein H6633_19090 [Anaerolineales bacterium]|nr:hypothetical protein [Anaerolineales bacterium]